MVISLQFRNLVEITKCFTDLCLHQNFPLCSACQTQITRRVSSVKWAGMGPFAPCGLGKGSLDVAVNDLVAWWVGLSKHLYYYLFELRLTSE